MQLYREKRDLKNVGDMMQGNKKRMSEMTEL